MMENYGYSQVVGNPNLPYTNELVANANTSTNNCPANDEVAAGKSHYCRWLGGRFGCRDLKPG
jgi:hypothetical protein